MFIRAIIGDHLYLAQGITSDAAKEFRCVSTTGVLEYTPFADDFGPFKLSHVFDFVQILDDVVARYPNARIAYCIEDGRRAFSNGVFLLGAYMLLRCEASAQRVQKCFAWVNESMYEPFRDPTMSKPDFLLTLADCWRALEKGRSNGWIGMPRNPQTFGMYDMEAYKHYDDPLNANMHMVVPGVIIAFKGPKDLGRAEFQDDLRGCRHFSPSYYLDIFREMNVTTVIRLNKPDYDASVFQQAGIAHYDLPVPEGVAPSHRIVNSFLRIVDDAPGIIAVHCKSGLGRTGTLIARLLLRSYGFSAREAIAWLRIVRPGSVVGEQQHYLCTVDPAACSPSNSPPSPAASPAPASPLPIAPRAKPTPAAPSASTRTLRAAAPSPAPAPARASASFTFGARRASCPERSPSDAACLSVAAVLDDGSPPPQSPGAVWAARATANPLPRSAGLATAAGGAAGRSLRVPIRA